MPATITQSCLDTLIFKDANGFETASPPGTVWTAVPPDNLNIAPMPDGSAAQLTVKTPLTPGAQPQVVTIHTATPNPVSGQPDIVAVDTVTIAPPQPGPAVSASHNFSNIV